MSESASISVRYASQRGEIWRWYWRAWRERLWRTHAAILFFLIAVGVVLRAPATGFIVGVLIVAALMIYPQLAYKPQTRTLTISADGIDTSIGAKSAQRKWAEIASVVLEERGVVMTVARTGNAFIVPSRAFDDVARQRAFFEFATAAWKGRTPAS